MILYHSIQSSFLVYLNDDMYHNNYIISITEHLFFVLLLLKYVFGILIKKLVSDKRSDSVKPVISIGNQDFRSIREHHYFFIDKTNFIKEWWENGNTVTLVTRPRRFGKTLYYS